MKIKMRVAEKKAAGSLTTAAGDGPEQGQVTLPVWHYTLDMAPREEQEEGALLEGEIALLQLRHTPRALNVGDVLTLDATIEAAVTRNPIYEPNNEPGNPVATGDEANS